jgi:hypothetical protein
VCEAFYVRIGCIASAFSCIAKERLRTGPDMEAREFVPYTTDMAAIQL